MNQKTLKLIIGVAGIFFAVLAIVLFFVALLAMDGVTGWIRIPVFCISVLCLLIAGELAFMFFLDNEEIKPNYFLYNRDQNRNISVQKLSFQVINTRMNRYLSNFAPSEGKLWTDKIIEATELDEQFKPAVAYKLLYDLAEKDVEQGWRCFELASYETVDTLCGYLELNDDNDMANTLRQMKSASPLNLKYVRDYIVNNRNYLKVKMCRYIYDNINLFD